MSQSLSIGFLIADISRLMRKEFQKHLQDSGLTFAGAKALMHISRCEGLRQVDLAEVLEIAPITMARLVDQLVETGVVERRADPRDRRAYRLYLLPNSEPHLKLIEEAIGLVREKALAGLTIADQRELMNALAKLRTNLN